MFSLRRLSEAAARYRNYSESPVRNTIAGFERLFDARSLLQITDT